MEKYLFFGVVIPERSNLTIQGHRRSIVDKSGDNVGSIEIDIKDSQAVIILNTDLQQNIPTLRNVAYDQTRALLSSASLLLGGGYDIDITTCFKLSSSQVETFSPRTSSIVKFIDSSKKLEIDDAIKATNGPLGYSLQCAMEDFSDGLRCHGRNSMFFFYRAFDSLRKFVGELYSIQKEGEQWEKLRAISNLERAEIEFIKNFADPVRHGGSTAYSIAEIETAEKLVWSAIHEIVVHYKDRSYK